MSWTYSGDPQDSDLDYVRYLVQDTNEDDQLIQDEEIEASLVKNGSDVIDASVEVARTIAAKFARLADIETGDYSEDLSQKAQNYRQLAKDLERDNRNNAAGPFAGGTSKDDKDSRRQDTDRPDPTFTEGMHDF